MWTPHLIAEGKRLGSRRAWEDPWPQFLSFFEFLRGTEDEHLLYQQQQKVPVTSLRGKLLGVVTLRQFYTTNEDKGDNKDTKLNRTTTDLLSPVPVIQVAAQQASGTFNINTTQRNSLLIPIPISINHQQFQPNKYSLLELIISLTTLILFPPTWMNSCRVAGLMGLSSQGTRIQSPCFTPTLADVLMKLLTFVS